MKRKLLTLVLSLLFIGAYATPRVVDFRINAAYLLPGSLTLNVTGNPTAFNGTFTVLRGTASGTSQPESIFCSLDIVLINKAGAFKKSLSSAVTFVTDDNTSNYSNRTINGSVSQSDIAAGDQVVLRIAYLDAFGTQVTTLGGGFSYSTSIPATNPGGPTNPGGGGPTGPSNPNNPPNPPIPSWPISSAGALSNMAGIDISNNDHVYFWAKSGQVTVGNSTSTTGPTTAYILPSGKQYTDIIDVAIASTGYCYTWYKDGTMSVGSPTNLGDYIPNKQFALPAGKTPADIMGISIAKNSDKVYTWYKNGTMSIGNSTELAPNGINGNVFFPAGKTSADVLAMGIAGSSSWVYTWFSDNTMCVGNSNDLAINIPLKPMN